MALNPLDEIRNLGAPEALGGGAPPPGMGGGGPDMGGLPPMPPSGPAMGGSVPPVDPGVGAEALDFAMGDPAMAMGDPAMAMDAEGLGEPELGAEAGTDEAATQVAFAIVEMAPSPDEAMNLANAISEKVASMVMEEDMDTGAGGDRLVELGLGLGAQVGGSMQGYNARLDESLGARNRRPMLQSLRDRRNESKGMERAMGKPAYSAVGSMDRNGIGSLMMNRGGEPTMAGGRPIQWQQGPVGQRRRQDFMNYMAPQQARRQLRRQASAGGPGRAATSGIGMWRGGEPTMAGGRPIQWQQGPVGQRRRQDFMNYMAPQQARRQLARQAAAGGPGRFAGRGAGGG